MKKMTIWGRIATATVLAAIVQVSQAQILIGQTAGFTGPVGAGVKETTDGARLYIDTINAKGGVNGQKIELLSLDDKFDPKLTQENARILIEERGVLAMFLTRGTPHTEAIVPLLEKYNVHWLGRPQVPWCCTSPSEKMSSMCEPLTSAKPKKPLPICTRWALRGLRLFMQTTVLALTALRVLKRAW